MGACTGIAGSSARRRRDEDGWIDPMLERRMVVTVAGAMVVGLASAALPVAATPKQAVEPFPAELDPVSYLLPEDMTWDDYRPVPGHDWNRPQTQPPRKIRAAFILADFEDQPFVVEELGLTDDPTEFYQEFHFEPNELNNYHTINEYWLENSYGLVGVEADFFGPYTLPGKVHEYGLTSNFNNPSAECPSGDTCNRNIENEMLTVSAVDVTAATVTQGRDYEFRWFMHAGWDESGVWEEFGPMIFATQDDVANVLDERVNQYLGHPEEGKPDWAQTRYQRPDGNWTSWWAAKWPWANALPGVRSLQGESDGASVYAHELSHIFGVLDNYNNPHAPNPDRSYSGPWDMLSRGTFNGPGGPHMRWLIPATQGGTMGSHHMLRNKLRLGFIQPSDVAVVTQPQLDAGPVVVDVLQRAQPMTTSHRLGGLKYGINIALESDTGDTACPRPNNMRCDGGGYHNYTVEVVNRVGYDSFTPDHGVLIAKTKHADLAPFIWVVDSHPDDIDQIDYIRPDGTPKPYPMGDYRQLADATFKVGRTGTHPEFGDKGLAVEGETTNTYEDTGNDLKFLVLDQLEDAAGVLSYRVAVLRATPSPLLTYGVDAGVASTADPVPGTVVEYAFSVTNTGSATDIMRATADAEGADVLVLNDLLELGAGETGTVTVHVRADAKPGRQGQSGRGRPSAACPTVTFTAHSEGDTAEADSVTVGCQS
jgi:M6 family metalloprotease-like protein